MRKALFYVLNGDIKSGKNLIWELTIWHEVTYRNDFNQGRYEQEAR